MSKNLKEQFEIGYVKKAHGIKGEVLVHFYESDVSFLKKDLVIALDGTTYTIGNLKPHKSEYIVTLKEVVDRNSSELLKGKKFFINSSLTDKINNSGDLFLGSIIEYTLFNLDKKMGVIKSLTKTKAHDLVQIELCNSDAVVDLPWVDDFIVKVDHELKSVFFEAPLELFDPDFFSGAVKK